MSGESDKQNPEEECQVPVTARSAGVGQGCDGTGRKTVPTLRTAVVHCVYGCHATGFAPQKHRRNETHHFGRNYTGLVSNVSKRHAGGCVQTGAWPGEGSAGLCFHPQQEQIRAENESERKG